MPFVSLFLSRNEKSIEETTVYFSFVFLFNSFSMKVILLISFVEVLLTFVSSLDIEHEMKYSEKFSINSSENAIAYLNKFGYNDMKCEQNRENSTCSSSMESMLETFQNFYSLPITRKLDLKTLTLMRITRCKVADKVFTSNKQR